MLFSFSALLSLDSENALVSFTSQVLVHQPTAAMFRQQMLQDNVLWFLGVGVEGREETKGQKSHIEIKKKLWKSLLLLGFSKCLL